MNDPAVVASPVERLNQKTDQSQLLTAYLIGIVTRLDFRTYPARLANDFGDDLRQQLSV